MNYKTAYINTSDKGLAEELEKCNLPGVEILTRYKGTFVQGVLDIIRGSCVTGIEAERELQERVRLRYQKG